MPVGLDVGGGSLLDLRRFLRQVGRRQKAAGDFGGEPVHHAEDALDVLSLQFLGEQDLAGAGVLRTHVKAQLCGADLQQCAGNVGIGASIARDLLRLRGIHGLAVSAGTLHRAQHALSGEHIQTFYLCQVRGKHVGETVVEPVEGLVLREIIEIKHGYGLVLPATRRAGISTTQEPETRHCNEQDCYCGKNQNRAFPQSLGRGRRQRNLRWNHCTRGGRTAHTRRRQRMRGCFRR